MNILLISFSGRKTTGNCERSLIFLSQWLREEGVDSTLINMRDLEIRPCSGCDYECFDPNAVCPINDDVRFVYEKISLSDMVIMAVPTYSAAPPATYFAWRERSQCIFTHNDQYNRYSVVVKGYIVFGNEEAGGQEVVNILRQGSEGPSEYLMIQSHHYNQSSIRGELLDIPEVQGNLVSFMEDLLRKYDPGDSF